MSLIITDLDNTLYDWVTYFARSFSVMVDELEELIGVEREVLLAEFKAVHQQYGNSEQPFAILELPSVQRTFGTTSRQVLARKVEPCLHAFNRERKQTLAPYEGVLESLTRLEQMGHVLVAHTEAIPVNSYYRLVKLDLARFFRRLYALEGTCKEHPQPDRPRRLTFPEDFVRTVPARERKPNPELLLDITRHEDFSPAETLYVGDSLSRDISMAKAAGVLAVWARYGTRYDHNLWSTLVQVTHWTPEDVERDQLLRSQAASVKPDVAIDSFSEVVELVKILGEDGTRELPRAEAREPLTASG